MLSSFDASVNGGFLSNSESPGGSATKKREVRRVHNVAPLFISYITECTDEEFTLYGMPVHMVDIIGVVRDYKLQSTKATCTLEDQSGSIRAFQWLQADGDALAPLANNSYIRVFGFVRTEQGSKIIMIAKTIPVDDLNIVTHHRLQILQLRAYAERMTNAEVPMQQDGATSANAEVSTQQDVAAVASTSADAEVGASEENTHGLQPINTHGLKPIQFEIMVLLKELQTKEGLTREDILEHFDTAQAGEVCTNFDFLLNEGYVYTTTDDEHFKATVGF